MLTGLPQSPEVKYTWKMLHTTSLVLETCNGCQYNNPAKKSIYPLFNCISQTSCTEPVNFCFGSILWKSAR